MDLSLRLSYLFGTEEYVDLRRQIVLMRETIINHTYRERKTKTMCSGSLGEGVAYPESDDDVMFYWTGFRVVKTYSEATQAGDVLMVPSEFSPGYCLLRDVMRSYPDYVIQMIHEIPLVSSSLWKLFLSIETQSIHGPCLSGTIGYEEYDHAFCIPCYSWPEIANDWVLRARSYEWPSCEMILNIVHNGCHVVPVGDPDSPFNCYEWRISFSMAERALMHSFNHAQFLVYNLLRLTLKRVIEETFPGVLCSYFMKTALFYTIENTPKDLWCLQNLDTCFKACLSVLYYYVDHILCPNYFIPEYNMIKRKVNHTNRHEMLDLLRTLHTIGIVGIIILSGESDSLDDSLSATIMEYKLDKEFMFANHLHTCLRDTINFLNILAHDNTGCCTFYLYKFLRLLKCIPTKIKSELIEIIWNNGISYCCLKFIDHLITESDMNKRFYRLNKTLKAMLTIGFSVDVTTGKLTAATYYMHFVGKTETALYILRQLLSEYPPYALGASADDLKIQAYMDVMCGRGLTIDYKMRHVHSPHYRLYIECLNAFPSPLKMWITIMAGFPLDPLTYAYFLECLCHVQHQIPMLLMDSLRCLVNHIDDLDIDDDITEARMCVGIIKYVQGDNQSACRWLGSAYVMKDTLSPPYNDRLSYSVSTYIACLLNKNF